MKKKFVQDIQVGDFINDVFITSDKTIAQKKDGQPFLVVKLSDKTGTIRGVLWDEIDKYCDAFNKQDYVNINAKSIEYNNEVQLTINVIELSNIENINPYDFMPSTSRDVDQMLEHLKKLINSIQNPFLKQLLNLFFSDDVFSETFKKAPAAKKMHHAYLGGLLEHTLSVALLVEKVLNNHYRDVNIDLLMTGAILHDIGKIKEFNYDKTIDYSDEGRLLSHIVIGVQMIDEKIRQIKNFPEETAVLLRHLIVSHHGTREFGSPEPPKTLEAVILNQLDDLDSKVIGIRDFMKKENNDNSWTSYHRIHQRFFYKGKQ